MPFILVVVSMLTTTTANSLV